MTTLTSKNAQRTESNLQTIIKACEQALASNGDLDGEFQAVQNWVVNIALDNGMTEGGANLANAQQFISRGLRELAALRANTEEFAKDNGYTSFARAKAGMGALGNRTAVLAAKVPEVFRTLPPRALLGKTHTEVNRMKRCLPEIHFELLKVVGSAEAEGWDLETELEELTAMWQKVEVYQDVRDFYEEIIKGVNNIKDKEKPTHKDLGELVAEKVADDTYFGLFFKEDLLDALEENPFAMPFDDWAFYSGLPATSVLIAAANRVLAPQLSDEIFLNMFTAFCQELVEQGEAVFEAPREEENFTFRNFTWNKSVDLEQLRTWVNSVVERESKILARI